jgi:cytidine deaminase
MASVVDWRGLAAADRELIERAQEACARAYAPYSRFAVGAAVRAASGAIYSGANLENASSGLTICAEAAALAAANTAGELAIKAIAIVGFGFTGSAGALQIVTPCGSCRQLIAEAAQLAKSDVRVLCCNGELSEVVEAPISQLLPNAFGPDNLGLLRRWPELQRQLRTRVKQLTELRQRR